MNHMFQIFLPLNKADDWMIPGRMTYLRFPAILPRGVSFDDFWYGYDQVHLHDTRLTKGEEHVIEITAEELRREVSLDE